MANGIVYVSLYDGNLYALDSSSGAKLWQTHSGDFPYSSPAAANGVVYIGSEQTGVHAFDALTGEELWSFFTGLYTRGDPVIVNGMLYITSFSNLVYAFGPLRARPIPFPRRALRSRAAGWRFLETRFLG